MARWHNRTASAVIRASRSHRPRRLCGAAPALLMLAAAPAAAQGGASDPTDNLPTVDVAEMLGAANTCLAATGSAAVDVGVFTQAGWNAAPLTDEDGEAIEVPVTFLTRAAGDPLVVIPVVEGAPPVCVLMGVVTAGQAAVPAVQAAFAEAFGAGQTDGDEAVYTQGAHMIALDFEEDDEQGFIAQAAVIQPGD